MKPFSFNIEKTNVAKGFAILMMMWLHTFSGENSTELYTSICSMEGSNIEYLIAKACNPVGLFMVLSGYGLYLSFEKKTMATLQQRMNQTTQRVIRMYIPWWITLVLGLPVLFMTGVIVETPFSWGDFFLHIVAWRVDWNNVGWYILPFAIISYLLHFIFPSFKKNSLIWLVLGLLSYYGINKVYSLCWDFLEQYQGLKILCRLFEFLFPMLLGAYAAKNREWELKLPISDKCMSVLCTLCIPLMFTISVCLKGMPVYPIYCAFLVLFIVNAYYSKSILKVLSTLGVLSIYIWFIHLYLIPFTYQLKFSLLIYLCVVLLSLALSFVVELLSKRIQSIVLSKI